MNKWTASAVVIASLLLTYPIISAAKSVEQPKNWGVMYQDASCIVMTNAADSAGNSTANEIKMGYLHGNELILFFSVANKQTKGLKLPDGAKARFMVDGKPFNATVSIAGDQLIYMVDNSMDLQAALTHAKVLGGEIKLLGKPSYIPVTGLTLSSIPDAVRWLRTCSLIGIGALPK